MFATYALWVIGDILLLVILIRGIVASLIGHYPAFYRYIGFTLAVSVLRTVISSMFGLNSDAYYWVYHLPNLVSPVLLILVLREVWLRVRPIDSNGWRGTLVPGLVISLIVTGVGIRLFVGDGDPFFRYQAVALLAQTLACIFVYRRVCGRPELSLGRNLKGVLLGVAVLVGFQGLNFARLLFVNTPFEVFAFFLQFFYFLGLSIFAFSLWTYEPAVELNSDLRGRIGKVGEDLEKAVRILVSPR